MLPPGQWLTRVIQRTAIGGIGLGRSKRLAMAESLLFRHLPIRMKLLSLSVQQSLAVRCDFLWRAIGKQCAALAVPLPILPGFPTQQAAIFAKVFGGAMQLALDIGQASGC